MKIRIYGNSIRWRLNRGEVQRLQTGQTLQCVIDLCPQPLRYSVSADSADENWSLRFADGHMALSLPASVAGAWAKSEELSIAGNITTAGRECVKVLIEKDMECLHGSGENQDDCYPNPLAGNRPTSAT